MKRAVGHSSKNEPAPAPLSPATLLGLFEKMVLLRRFETAAQIACRKGETPGFLHLYIGEEATAVGVCAHLRPSDWITTTHRGHGHALAKGMAPDVLMAELFGRATGCCGGRGGTMHLYDRSIGLFGTNGIVAAGIAHAVGIGISATHRGRPTTSASPSSATARSITAASTKRSISPPCRRRRRCSSARTISTPRRRRLPMVTLNAEIAIQGRLVRHSRRRRRRQRRARRPRGDARRRRAGPRRRRTDADRGEDLSDRRPSRGRPGGRLLPHPGRDGRVAEARSDQDSSASG